MRGWIDGLLTLPLVLPPTVVGFFLLLIFGRRSLLGAALERVGITIVFSWPATVIAATVVAFPLPEALIVLALGVMAFVLVLIRLIVAPGYGDLFHGTIHVNRGAGLFVSLIATAVVAFGCFLKNSEPAS